MQNADLQRVRQVMRLAYEARANHLPARDRKVRTLIKTGPGRPTTPAAPAARIGVECTSSYPDRRKAIRTASERRSKPP